MKSDCCKADVKEVFIGFVGFWPNTRIRTINICDKCKKEYLPIRKKSASKP